MVISAAAQQAAEATRQGGMSQEDRQLWREQKLDAAAAGNLDFEALSQASSLPTLLEPLTEIPQLRPECCSTIVQIGYNTGAFPYNP